MTKSQTIIGSVVIAGFIILVSVLILYKANMIGLEDWMKQLIIGTFGAWLILVQQIVGYAFGSSQGSADKTKIIETKLKSIS